MKELAPYLLSAVVVVVSLIVTIILDVILSEGRKRLSRPRREPGEPGHYIVNLPGTGDLEVLAYYDGSTWYHGGRLHKDATVLSYHVDMLEEGHEWQTGRHVRTETLRDYPPDR
jgi:hypothetical protein